MLDMMQQLHVMTTGSVSAITDLSGNAKMPAVKSFHASASRCAAEGSAHMSKPMMSSIMI